MLISSLFLIFTVPLLWVTGGAYGRATWPVVHTAAWGGTEALLPGWRAQAVCDAVQDVCRDLPNGAATGSHAY